MSKSDKLSIPFKVYEGRVEFDNVFSSHEKINNLLKGYEGESGELTYAIHKGAAYYQYKYFFGFVVKYIAIAQGEYDINYVKEMLKEDYLFIKVNNKKEIPARHLEKCRIIERIKKQDGIICRDRNNRVIYEIEGYIPSLSVLDFKEFEAFIKFCVFIRDGLTGWDMKAEDRKKELECIERIKSYEINNK